MEKRPFFTNIRTYLYAYEICTLQGVLCMFSLPFHVFLGLLRLQAEGYDGLQKTF